MSATARSASGRQLGAHLEQQTDLEEQMLLPRQMGKSRERMSNGSFTSVGRVQVRKLVREEIVGTALCFVSTIQHGRERAPGHSQNSWWHDCNRRAPVPIRTILQLLFGAVAVAVLAVMTKRGSDSNAASCLVAWPSTLGRTSSLRITHHQVLLSLWTAPIFAPIYLYNIIQSIMCIVSLKMNTVIH